MNNNYFFLSLSNDYQTTFISLFCKDELIETVLETNKRASKNIFNIIASLLKRHNLNLKDCLFLATNQGPGPFTTLRTIITSANGLAFAAKIPLVGVDGLMTFMNQEKDSSYDYTIALLNAFCNDVYVGAYSTKTDSITIDCMNIDKAIELINQLTEKKIKVIGNGLEVHEERISILVTREITIPESFPHTVSAEAIGKQAWKQWEAQINVSEQLLPIYLKESL